MKHRITIPYFPKGLQYSSPLLFVGGIYLLFNQFIVLGIVLIFMAALVLTVQYVTEIDQDEKKIRDFIGVLFMPINVKVIDFFELKRMIISKDNHAYTANSRSRTRQVNFSSYTASIVYDNEVEFELITKNSYEDLKKVIEPLSTKLNVQIEKHA